MDTNLENSSLSRQISPLALSILLHMALIIAFLSLNYLSKHHTGLHSHRGEQSEATVIFAPDQAAQQPPPQLPFMMPQGQHGGAVNSSLPYSNIPNIEKSDLSHVSALAEEFLQSTPEDIKEKTQTPPTTSPQTAAQESLPYDATPATTQSSEVSEEKNEYGTPSPYGMQRKKHAPLTLSDIGKSLKHQLAKESEIAHAGSGNGQEWHAGAKNSNAQLITDRTNRIALDRFMLKLGKIVENHFNVHKNNFPATAVLNSVIRLGIRFNKYGKVLDLAIIQSSGSTEIDTVIMDMFRNASKLFPKLPDFLGEYWATQFSIYTEGYLKGAVWRLNDV